MNKRIYRVILVATVLALVGFGLPLAIVVSKLNQNEALVRLEREAARASLGVRSPAAFDNPTARLGGADEHHEFGVYDMSGKLRLGSGPSSGGAVVERALDGNLSSGTVGGQLVVALPVSNDEQVFGVMRAATPESEVHAAVVRSWTLMGLLAVVIIFVAAAVGRWESRRLSRPVDELSVAVTRLGDGDFTTSTSRSGVPEIDQAADALDATAARLGALLERERAFSSNASHQLRTPLTGLRLQLENALLLPGDQREESIVEALAATERLETTISDLLTLARDAEPERQPIDLGELVTSEASAWRRNAKHLGRSIHTRVGNELPPVRVAPAAVRQILEVLVSNALTHGEGVVTVEVMETAGGVAIEVIDQGAGVDSDPEELFRARRAPELQTRRRGANGRGHPATRHGIGLPLARSLAEAEGGRLILREPGPRPCFALFLPGPSDRPLGQERAQQDPERS